MPTLLLRNADWIYTCDDRRTVIRNGYVFIRDGKIESLGPEPAPMTSADEVVSLAGCLVTPGLVNAHHHLYQSLTRAVPSGQRGNIVGWLGQMYPLWAFVDADAFYWAALATSCELLASGCTTNADFAYLLPEVDGEITAEEIRGVREAGMRLTFIRGSMPTIEANLEAELRPVLGQRLDRLLDREEELWPKLDRVFAKYHDAGEGSMLQVAIGPTGVTYRRPQYMKRFGEFSRANRCGLHTHFDPRPDEIGLMQGIDGRDPIDFVADAGWLHERTWFAHSTLLNDYEMRRISEAGVSLAHCPRCVVRVGKRVTRLAHWRKHGINFGIGVDGSASNDSSNLLNEIRLALVLHRIGGYGDDYEGPETWLTPEDILWYATRGGAKALCRDDIGQLAPGKGADVAAFSMRRLSCAGAVLDPLGGLLLSGSDPYAALTVAAGRIRVRDGKVVDIDENRMVDGLNGAAQRLVDQATQATGIDFTKQDVAIRF